MKRILLLILCFACLGTLVGWRVDLKRETTPVKDLVALALALASFVLQQEERKSRNRPRRAKERGTLPARTLWGSCGGGLLGGAFAGVIVSSGYYIQSLSWAEPLGIWQVSEVFLYSTWVGLAVGACTHAGMRILSHQITGALAGGLVGGIPVGALGGFWFGLRKADPINLTLLVIGSLLGSIFVVAGIVLYDYQDGLRRLVRPLLASVLILPLIVLASIVLRLVTGFDTNWFYRWNTEKLAMAGGAMLGAAVGFLLGLEIGLTLWLYRRIEAPEGRIRAAGA